MLKSSAKQVRLAVTLGEPAGIGPDIFLQLVQRQAAYLSQLIVFGSPSLLMARAKLLGISLRLYEFGGPVQEGIAIVPIELPRPSTPGLLLPENSLYVLESLEKATQACLLQQCQAMVTGPVHKSILRQYLPSFLDQTHLIAAQCHVPYEQVMMGFISPDMRLGLGSLHEPLAQIPALFHPTFIENKIRCFGDHLKRYFCLPRPKIGVLGLNPHAGEEGLLGQEEIERLKPVLERLKNDYDLSEPLSPDSAFLKAHRDYYDGFLAWYHDQGLGPFKTLYEQKAATLLFGLPIVRTSVDHGTALALAGTLKAQPDSLDYAIQLALLLTEKTYAGKKALRATLFNAA